MAEKVYDVAVIGYGHFGEVFMTPFLLEESSRLKLYAIIQRNPTDSNDAAHDHSKVKVYRSSEEMLDDEGLTLSLS